MSAGMDPTADEPGAPVEAVVVAAGSSRRMDSLDKLAAELDGRTVLRWSVEAIAAAGVGRVVVVASASRVPEIAAAPWLPPAVVAVVAGGDRRQESVAAGVAALAARPAAGPAGRPPAPPDSTRPSDPVILVHDAARPLVSPELVRAVARGWLALNRLRGLKVETWSTRSLTANH